MTANIEAVYCRTMLIFLCFRYKKALHMSAIKETTVIIRSTKHNQNPSVLHGKFNKVLLKLLMPKNAVSTAALT